MQTLKNVTPTAEQLKILTDAGPGFRLIRGAAGSGKTTAAVLRLRQLCASRLKRRDRLGYTDPIRVLVLTFNRTLRAYVNQLASEQVSASDALLLTVETFASWALSLIGHVNVTNGQDHIRRLLRCIDETGANREYFVGEVEYILGRFPPKRREEYIRATRSGRGRAPAVPAPLRKRLLAEVIEPYEALKSRNGYLDWNDIAVKVAAVESQGYDIVVADESQDLSANQIRAVRAHLDEDHATTFIIDATQRIYPQSFRWRELNVEMRPEMVSTLSRNQRNTVEVARFASSLVQNLPAEEDGVLPDPRACKRKGPRPQIVSGTYSRQLNYMLDQIQPFLEKSETVAILQPKGGGWFDFAKQALSHRNTQFVELTRTRDWPTGPELVALSTIHSVKGLEFDHVLLPGLNQEVTPHGDEEGDGDLDALRRLVAMGVGRARHTVMVGFKPGEQSTLIGLIDPATYDLVEV